MQPIKYVINLFAIFALGFIIQVAAKDYEGCSFCGRCPEGRDDCAPEHCEWKWGIGINLDKQETESSSSIRFSKRNWKFEVAHVPGTDLDDMWIDCQAGGTKYNFLVLPVYNGTVEYWWCHGGDRCHMRVPRRFLSLYSSAGFRLSMPGYGVHPPK